MRDRPVQLDQLIENAVDRGARQLSTARDLFQRQPRGAAVEGVENQCHPLDHRRRQILLGLPTGSLDGGQCVVHVNNGHGRLPKTGIDSTDYNPGHSFWKVNRSFRSRSAVIHLPPGEWGRYKRPMHLGIVTPVLIQHPSTRSEWEASADIGEIATVAATADRLGFHHLTCSEHVAVPEEIAAERGGTYWDPLATLGFLAARTSRILLATQVLVLGYHHPLEIAKRYGTLDRVSNGRLILGLGVGTLKQEFDLINAPFADRGARADDALAALRHHCRRRLRSITASSTTTPDLSSNLTRSRNGCRCGSAAGPRDRCAGPPHTATGGCRSGCDSPN